MPVFFQPSVPELIAALNRIAESDWEKTRALFIWTTHNIAYDTDSFFRGISGPSDAAGTFETEAPFAMLTLGNGKKITITNHSGGFPRGKMISYKAPGYA